MHNNIMAVGSRDRPSMLATGRYAQWQSRFLRYTDTRTNGDALRKCILEGPYEHIVTILAVPATDDTPAVPERTAVETILTMQRDSQPITHPFESASEEESDPEQVQRDKDMQKNLALIAKYFKKIYKPTNNNLRTSLNSRNKNVDTSPRYKNDNQTGQFGNQRTVTVAGLGRLKPKRVKDYTYHKEKMLLCKQAEKGVPLQVKQDDWLEDTDEEIDEELEAHYGFMVKIQEVLPPESNSTANNTCLVEKDDSNVTPDSPDMCENDIQTDQNAKDERVALANLIANLKLDTSRTLGESNSIRDSCLIALQNKQTEFERYKTLNDRTVDYDKLEHKLNETLGLLAQKEIDIKEGLKLKAYEISVVKEKHDDLVKHSLLTKSHYEGLVKEKIKVITNLKLKEEKAIDKMISMEKQLKFLNEIVYKRNQSIQTIHMLAPKGPTFNGRPTFANPRMLYEKTSKAWKWWIEQQCPSGYKWVPKTKMKWVPKVRNENVNRRVSFAIDNASRITNGNDLLTGNRGSNLYTISLQETSSSTPICFMAKASPTQAWLWHRRLSHLNFDYINLLSKKDVVIGLPKLKYVKDQLCSSCEVSKAKRSSFKTKVVPSSKGRLNLLHIDLCGLMRVDNINGKKYILVIVDDYSRYTWTLFLKSKDETPEVLKEFLTMIQRNLQALASFPNDKRSQIMTTLAPVNKSSSPIDNSKQQDTPPTTNIQSLTEPTTPTNVNAEENNDNQAADTQFQQDEFINPLCTQVREVGESSSRNIDNSNMHTFNQPQYSEYRWTKDHSLSQVHGNPSKPVQTR
ncbi:retrovirus-related pol polyprotein from transposon TNT 1-94 [Tanacetum coccineum]|uniref:Retrovirus-related pol polyprotein from transposon TNT 1-94 n=1 Tax=Tanacetum coccineum TaxID=301880 RepID=A0ABQ5EY47_9ASTR